MIPHHVFIGRDDAPKLAYLTHGVLGAGHNFRSFIKRLCQARSEYRFALIDLRYHGKSLGAPPPHTIAACARDLAELSESLERGPDAMIGHSLGGKVALEFGRLHMSGEMPVEEMPFDATRLKQIWALDTDPGAQQPGESHQVLRVLGALKKNPGPFNSRGEAVEAIVKEELSSGLAHWLSTNLERSKDEQGTQRYTWRLQIAEIDELLDDYFQKDMWPFLERVAADACGHGPQFELLVAENSDRWSGSMHLRARKLPQKKTFRLHILPDSGHWVHVDNPEELLSLLETYLP